MKEWIPLVVRIAHYSIFHVLFHSVIPSSQKARPTVQTENLKVSVRGGGFSRRVLHAFEQVHRLVRMVTKMHVTYGKFFPSSQGDKKGDQVEKLLVLVCEPS